MDEFCIYAGLGANTSKIIAETTGALFRVGHRMLADRVKFDKYVNGTLYGHKSD